MDVRRSQRVDVELRVLARQQIARSGPPSAQLVAQLLRGHQVAQRARVVAGAFFLDAFAVAEHGVEPEGKLHPSAINERWASSKLAPS